jgi:cob(I)alamin adenosyltransferase
MADPKTPDRKGYIQVYTGNGKGKTTAALGLALRAAGRGKKTYIAQFMKKGEYGELSSTGRFLSAYVTIEQFGLPAFHTTGQAVSPEEREAALAGIKAVKAAIEKGDYDIIVLDEVNVLLYFHIVPLSDILEILDRKPERLELVLTGRQAPPEIIDRADLVTEMKEIKHYYTRDVPSRLGIEY